MSFEEDWEESARGKRDFDESMDGCKNNDLNVKHFGVMLIKSQAWL